jgi:hypothetical protein
MATIIIPPSKDIADVVIKKIKDKEVYLFNAIEGAFDMAIKFNVDRILTSGSLPNGAKRLNYDPTANVYYDAGPEIITDNDGNVIVSKG